MKNEILEEVWRSRDEFARKHDYDIHSMVIELQKMESHSSIKLVDRRKGMPNKATEANHITPPEI